MTEQPEMSMVFAFDDQSPSFVNGFELGMIWQEVDGEGKLTVDRGFDEGFPVHDENVEVLRRMANARGYKLETKPPVDGWVAAKLSYVGTGNAKPVLSIVPGSDQ
jgi:hypothetical protein